MASHGSPQRAQPELAQLLDPVALEARLAQARARRSEALRRRAAEEGSPNPPMDAGPACKRAAAGFPRPAGPGEGNLPPPAPSDTQPARIASILHRSPVATFPEVPKSKAKVRPVQWPPAEVPDGPEPPPAAGTPRSSRRAALVALVLGVVAGIAGATTALLTVPTISEWAAEWRAPAMVGAPSVDAAPPASLRPAGAVPETVTAVVRDVNQAATPRASLGGALGAAPPVGGSPDPSRLRQAPAPLLASEAPAAPWVPVAPAALRAVESVIAMRDSSELRAQTSDLRTAPAPRVFHAKEMPAARSAPVLKEAPAPADTVPEMAAMPALVDAPDIDVSLRSLKQSKTTPLSLHRPQRLARAAPAAIPTKDGDQRLTFGAAQPASPAPALSAGLDGPLERGASAKRARLTLVLPGNLGSPAVGYILPPEQAPAAQPVGSAPAKASSARATRAASRTPAPERTRSAPHGGTAVKANLSHMRRTVEETLRKHLRGD